MRIYTKTGDKGETSLFGGKRVPKDNMRVEAYGEVDELNAMLGAIRFYAREGEIDGVLHEVQRDLFRLGADLATPEDTQTTRAVPRIGAEEVERLEKTIDRVQGRLSPLTSFILPGGSQIASSLHLARAVCRRAERRTVTLTKSERVNERSIVYLNRLSDLLFVLARLANREAGVTEEEWRA